MNPKFRIYLFGTLLICLLISIVGTFFNLIHFPESIVLTLVGFGASGFFITAFLINILERTLSGYLAAAILGLICLALLFHLKHGQGARLLLEVGVGLGAIMFVCIFFFRNKGDTED